MLFAAVALYLILAYVIFIVCLVAVARLLFPKIADQTDSEIVAHTARRLSYRMTGRKPVAVARAGTKFLRDRATN